jgi:hypothetical protein
MNVTAKSDKTYHFIISLQAGEKVSAETLHQIEDRFCAGLGFADYQRVSVIHRDTDHLHIHVAVTKIHPERHTLYAPYGTNKTRSRLSETLETGNHRSQTRQGGSADVHAPCTCTG